MGLCASSSISLFLSTFTFSNPQVPTPPSHSHSPTERLGFLFYMDSPSESNGDEPSQSKQTSRSETNVNRHNHRTSSGVVSSNFIGKHRLAAIISQQNQQIQIIQEELDQLETLGEASLVCEQLISSVESSTDALLPVTRGPADGGWDRWFQRANHSSRNRKRWI
ncbi:unnamed protein product [Lactuca saligna]|uniref:G protein gamma domain-containing protein n=1 Tax=Lactuca saligna TaxID=75948 RepID=A0AA35YJB8_LACSI|nr:unnamed protein product [Lactuca saligna]